MTDLAKWLGCALIALLGLLLLQIEPRRAADPAWPAHRTHAGVSPEHRTDSGVSPEHRTNLGVAPSPTARARP